MWLYVPPQFLPCTSASPGEASACAQASEGSTSASTLSNPAIAQSLTWRGKPAPLPLWSRRWKAGGFIRRLSGLTLEPSTAARGAAAFISSLPEIPASRTALPDAGSARPTTGSSSISLSGWWRSAGLCVSSARTSRGTPTDSSACSSRHWKAWAIAVRSEYSARPGLALPTSGNDFSSWPTSRVSRGGYTRDNGDPEKERPTLEGAAATWATPTAHDGRRPGADIHSTQGGNLSRDAATWSTPRASDGEKGGPNQSFGAGGVPLPSQAANWPTPTAVRRVRSDETLQKCADFRMRNAGQKTVPLYLEEVAVNWPTPAAWDFKGANSAAHVETAPGSAHMDQLPNFVAHGFRPSPPDPATPDGQPSSPERRSLNPLFVEWLMGWPTGLSGFARSETAWCRWLQQMRGYLWTLGSAETPPQGSLL